MDKKEKLLHGEAYSDIGGVTFLPSELDNLWTQFERVAQMSAFLVDSEMDGVLHDALKTLATKYIKELQQEKIL